MKHISHGDTYGHTFLWHMDDISVCDRLMWQLTCCYGNLQTHLLDLEKGQLLGQMVHTEQEGNKLNLQKLLIIAGDNISGSVSHVNVAYI